MYITLKSLHLIFILLAIGMFILNFYWLKSGHENAQKAIYKKVFKHSHITAIALGFALAGLLRFNMFAESGFWLLEKLLAFVAYYIMAKAALNDKNRSHIQWVTFIGAFGWLAYIASLAVTKQAILIAG